MRWEAQRVVWWPECMGIAQAGDEDEDEEGQRAAGCRTAHGPPAGGLQGQHLGDISCSPRVPTAGAKARRRLRHELLPCFDPWGAIFSFWGTAASSPFLCH